MPIRRFASRRSARARRSTRPAIESFGADYKAMAKDADTDVVMQALLTLNTLKVADGKAVISRRSRRNKAKGVQLVATPMLKPSANAGRGGGSWGAPALYTADEQRDARQGAGDLHASLLRLPRRRWARREGAGRAERGDARAAAGLVAARARPPDYVVKALLHGLTGPIDGATYTEVMIPMGQNNDEWIAAIASYIRNSFGNRASLVSPADVARVRAATAARKTPWTSASSSRRCRSSWSSIRRGSSRPATTRRRPSTRLSIQPWTSGRAAAGRACGCRWSCRSRRC